MNGIIELVLISFLLTNILSFLYNYLLGKKLIIANLGLDNLAMFNLWITGFLFTRTLGLRDIDIFGVVDYATVIIFICFLIVNPFLLSSIKKYFYSKRGFAVSAYFPAFQYLYFIILPIIVYSIAVIVADKILLIK